MDLDFFSKILTGDASSIFADEENILWVDWRQCEDEIVASLSARLGLPELTCNIEDDSNEHGYRVVITYRENSITVDPAGELDTRHATLNAVDELVAPEHEIRYALDTEGGDSIGIAAGSVFDWQTLLNLHGTSVDERFCPVRQLPDLLQTPPNQIRSACKAYADRNG